MTDRNEPHEFSDLVMSVALKIDVGGWSFEARKQGDLMQVAITDDQKVSKFLRLDPEEAEQVAKFFAHHCGMVVIRHKGAK